MDIRALVFFSAAILAASTHANSPHRITSASYPVTFKESSKQHSLAIGSSAIELDTSKSDLELVIWKTNKTFALEVNVDVTNVNQSVLPTDSSGRLLPRVTQLDAVPWIKVYLAGQAPQTLDVVCDSRKKQCQGVWKNFPYHNNKEQIIKIEANLRGLEGKIWSPLLNAYSIHADKGESIGLKKANLNPIYKTKPKARAAVIEVTRFYDLLQFPAYFANLKLLSIYEWNFLNNKQMRESGFFKTLRKTLFHVDQGQFIVETLQKETLQAFEIMHDQTFFAETQTILSFASKELKNQKNSKLRILEFE